MLDSAIAAQDMLPKAIAAVAEAGTPGHGDVLGKIESDGNRIRNFAAIFFRVHAAGHVSRCGQREVEGAHDPGNLVHHVFGDVSTRELPEQAPVDELVAVKGTSRAAIEEGIPDDG